LDFAGNVDLAAAAHRNAALTPLLKGAGAFLHHNSRSLSHPVLVAIATREAICVPEIGEAYLRCHSVSAEHEHFMRTMKYRSMMVVPLISKTQGVIGTITFVLTGESNERYDDESLRFGHDLARRCATAIGKAMLYEKTLRIATVYQRAALPERLPQVEGFSFDAFYEPSSEELLVGGDWYDAFRLSDGRIAITVGDVLGHGIDAAVWMGRLRNGLRAALFSKPDAAHALEVADEMLHVELREAFTTALIALIDPVRRSFSCASAGHPGPLVWDGSGKVIDPFEVRGLPLGLRSFGSVAKTSQVLEIRDGFFAAFFTDGLLEWNRDIVEAWSQLNAAISVKDVREALHPAKAIRDYAIAEGARHEDDVAILTLRFGG
jgi:serine phosphatase RsbU (regulator of sigma subunit)